MKPLFATIAIAMTLNFGSQLPAVASNTVVAPNYDSIATLEQSAPQHAFEQMVDLANSGSSKAQARVGYYYRNGIGTKKDLKSAEFWYAKAVENGRDYALLPLALLKASDGQGEVAFFLLNRAVEAEMPGAERNLALLHIDRKLGTKSSHELGIKNAMALFNAGDQKIARPLLQRYNWNRLKKPANNALVRVVETQGLGGDSRAAETALVYLSSLRSDTKINLQRREALIKVPGIRSSILAGEQVKLAARNQPDQFWDVSEALLDTVAPKDFEKAALETYKINKNAFYRIAQKRLNALGYDAGPADGLLGRKTIDAINAFCRDKGIWETCAQGPRRTPTIRALARELAQVKTQ